MQIVSKGFRCLTGKTKNQLNGGKIISLKGTNFCLPKIVIGGIKTKDLITVVYKQSNGKTIKANEIIYINYPKGIYIKNGADNPNNTIIYKKNIIATRV